MKKNREGTEQTIKGLITIARKHFSTYGYADVSLEGIVAEAGMTRGALYHHFNNKKGLFLAVFEEVQMEIRENVEGEAAKHDDAWDQLLNGSRAFLAAALKSQNEQILLIDGPAVLGWNTFREMDGRYSMDALREQLEMMQEKNLLAPVSADALTHCLSGAMNEAVLWISDREKQEDILDETMTVISSLLHGLKL
ncbi:TetR/AcrR family transcriptional regulator [Salinicoccus albus]|uniref:TetR/AcrR family transcriptional regulator n=1 Tax=Salinicoccus albus TaxID=418756 RepID=UPI000362880B|nr:TetR/AcrR family transcriptional regulator [Salinicoccus albus]